MAKPKDRFSIREAKDGKASNWLRDGAAAHIDHSSFQYA
jgi:hypothetical protein